MALFIGGGPHLKTCETNIKPEEDPKSLLVKSFILLQCSWFCYKHWQMFCVQDQEQRRLYLNISRRRRAMSLNHFLCHKSNTTIPYFRRLIIATQGETIITPSKKWYQKEFLYFSFKFGFFKANLVQNIVDFELIWIIGSKTLQFFLKKKIK